MNFRPTLKYMAMALMAGQLMLAGCKKDKNDPADDADLTSVVDQAEDESTGSSEGDVALGDVENLISTSRFAGGRFGDNVCGASIDSVFGERVYHITFDGTTVCNGRIRSGKIHVQLLNADQWKGAGAVLYIHFDGYSVTQQASGKTFVADGTGKIYNLYGGLVRNLATGMESDSVVHRIRISGVRFNFSNSGAKTWNVAKRRVYRRIPGGTVVLGATTYGDTSVFDLPHVATYGTNRHGQDFATQFLSPVKSNNGCGWGRPTSGVKFHSRFGRDVKVTLGTDAQGVPLNPTGTNTCADYFKAEWTSRGGGNQTRVIAYR